MLNTKKFLACILSAALAVTGLTACAKKEEGTPSENQGQGTGESQSGSGTQSSGNPEKFELLVWGPQEEQSGNGEYQNGILPALCEQFNELHPEWDITFKYGVCGEDLAKEEVTKDVEAAADVYYFANDQIPILVKAGAIAKLGGSTVEAMKASDSESMVNSVTYEDHIYGVPFSPNTWFMYYDKSKFTEEEVKSLDTMMEKDLGAGVTNFAFPLDNSWYIAAFYYAAGGTLFGDGTDPEGGCTFAGTDGIAATRYMVNLMANPKFSNEKDGSSLAKFKAGKLGAYCTGSWDAVAIQEALGDNFAATKIPTVTINGKEGQMKSFAGCKAIGVNPTTDHMQAAVALALYLGGEEAQMIRYQVRGITPTNHAVSESAQVKADPVAAAEALELDEASVAQPVLSEMDSYWKPAESMGKEIVQGNVTEANAEEKTRAMVDGILNPGL